MKCKDCGRDIPNEPVLRVGWRSPLCRRHYDAAVTTAQVLYKMKRLHKAQRSWWRRVLHMGV